MGSTAMGSRLGRCGIPKKNRGNGLTFSTKKHGILGETFGCFRK